MLILFTIFSFISFTQNDSTLRKNNYKISGLMMISYSRSEPSISIGATYYKFEGGKGSTYFGMQSYYLTAGYNFRENSTYPSISAGYSRSILFLDLGLTCQTVLSNKTTLDVLPHIGLTLSGFATIYLNYSLIKHNEIGIGVRVFFPKWKTT